MKCINKPFHVKKAGDRLISDLVHVSEHLVESRKQEFEPGGCVLVWRSQLYHNKRGMSAARFVCAALIAQNTGDI